MQIKRAAFVVISSLIIVFSAFSKEKPKVDLEDELGITTEEPKEDVQEEVKGKLKSEEVVVEGEDEQLFRNQKESAKEIKPTDSDLTNWRDPADKIPKKEKQGAIQVEKKAQLRTEYGTYQTLAADIYVTKADEFGVYMLEYNRMKYDSEGFGVNTVANSAFSSDRLILSSGFNFNQNYKLLLKTSYEDYLQGLQKNPTYTQQFRRGAFLDVNNQIRPSEFQRLNLDVNTEYISSSIENNNAARNRDQSFYWRTKVGADWQYIFGNRNAFSVGGNLWYAENQLYALTSPSYYRVGEFRAKDTIPLYRTTMGKQKTPWQLDLNLGVQVFFAQQMKPVWGPTLSIDSFLGSWYSKLAFERKGAIPETREDFLQRHYSQPVVYNKPEDRWSISWENTLRLNVSQVLKWDTGMLFYETYFDRNYFAATELLSQKALLFRAPYIQLSWEHSPGKIFFYEIGARGEWQIDEVTLRTPAQAFVKGHLIPDGWDFGMELAATANREVPDANVTLKPFFLWNASLEKKINPTVSAYLRFQNIFNERYMIVYPYEASGFKFFAGVNIYI